MSSSDPRGSQIKHLAECGHWIDCYALEPTPTECPQCAVSPQIAMAGDDLLPTMKRLKPLPETT